MYAPRCLPGRSLLTLSLALAIASCSSQDGDKEVESASVNAVPLSLERQKQSESTAAAPLMDSRAFRRMEPSLAMSVAAPASFPPPTSSEQYVGFEDNGVFQTLLHPVSTFSIDVDTGSYSNVRRFLSDGALPPQDAVRTEELVNYFSYDYPPTSTDAPFTVMTEVAPSPWHSGRHLLHIGIKATEPQQHEDLQSNLVFLVDVSGSMQSPDKIELLKTSLKMLARELSANDSIAIVVYAGASGVVLEPTPGDNTRSITNALDQLQAGGSTNGAAGIELAYQLAAEHFAEGGINRVLLATDGDFNVGVTKFDELIELIEDRRKTGISLTTLGFGTGNYNDHLMEQLADAGNGNYAYIDSINEARKVLVEEMSGTLQTVAKDVKIQIEFNPAQVTEYRLIGYENRMLNQEDFNNDRVDAGEIGAGHEVTALYELTLVGSDAKSIDPLRYVTQGNPLPIPGTGNEVAFLKLRYKSPESDTSELVTRALLVGDVRSDVQETSADYRFAAAVAGFSQLLRNNEQLSDFDYDDVIALATAARGGDVLGYRSEFINLVKTAQALSID